MSEYIWKIRQKSTGMFAMGGSPGVYCFWSKKGKKWNARHHLASHIRSNPEFYLNIMDDIEILCLETKVSNKEDGVKFVTDILNNAKRRENERMAKYKEDKISSLKEQQKRLEDDLERLQK